MSARFHIGNNGPGLCRVDPLNTHSKGCPFGGETGVENHYNTQEEAVMAFEKQLESEHGIITSTSKISKVEKQKRLSNINKRRIEIFFKELPRPTTSEEHQRNLKESYIQSLKEVHNNVRESGSNYFIGDNEVYVPLYYNGRYQGLGNPGHLPKELGSTVMHSSEHKLAKVNGKGRERVFGYASVELANGEEIYYETDKDGYPSNVGVWEHIDYSKIPEEFHSNKILNNALKNKGIIKD